MVNFEFDAIFLLFIPFIWMYLKILWGTYKGYKLKPPGKRGRRVNYYLVTVELGPGQIVPDEEFEVHIAGNLDITGTMKKPSGKFQFIVPASNDADAWTVRNNVGQKIYNGMPINVQTELLCSHMIDVQANFSI